MKMMNKTFQVNGMKCVHCKVNVENAVKAMAGVTGAEADLENKSLTVDFDEAQVTVEGIKTAVENAGYEFVG
uniref:HMA domain-containing protein n=1 Tax=Prevotella sp. GTC17260 TaxID=3236796 RepID=A0AB33JEB1_9BACT